GAAAVVERDPQIQRPVALGLALERRHALLQGLRRPVAPPDEACAHALTHQVGKLALDRLGEDLHQELDFLGWAGPGLRREGGDRERLAAEVDGRLYGAAQRLRAGTMAGRDRQTPLARPTRIAVHDDRDGARDVR